MVKQEEEGVAIVEQGRSRMSLIVEMGRGKQVIELHDTFLQPCFSCFKDSLKTSA
jgi:hypothetical protein